MIREHNPTGDPYDPANVWSYTQARAQYVASVGWCEAVNRNDGFNGPSRHVQTVRVAHAESDDLDDLRQWCATQAANGAARANIHRTWVIGPGKRDNAFLEKVL